MGVKLWARRQVTGDGGYALGKAAGEGGWGLSSGQGGR